MPTVKVNDINIYYEVLGEGNPLIFIGGLSADISDYDGVLHSLAKKCKLPWNKKG